MNDCLVLHIMNCDDDDDYYSELRKKGLYIIFYFIQNLSCMESIIINTAHSSTY